MSSLHAATLLIMLFTHVEQCSHGVSEANCATYDPYVALPVYTSRPLVYASDAKKLRSLHTHSCDKIKTPHFKHVADYDEKTVPFEYPICKVSTLAI